MRGLPLLIALALLGCERPAPTPVVSPAVADPAPIRARGLHNVFRVSNRIYSGSSPDGDEGFAELERLGVKTIISVDGARPDVEAARRHGIAYVHLPFGYDGIPRERVIELARAATMCPGPIYVHCHHGQHRGPAAVAAIEMCIDPNWTADRAETWLNAAGTDPRYTGLRGLPRSLVPPTPDELERAPTSFVPIAALDSLTRLMVDLDANWDNLKLVQSAGWVTPKGHPDVEPAHEALMIVEHFREAARLEGAKRRGSEFLALLHDGETAATELEGLLRAARRDSGLVAKRFARLAANCAACHERFRDRPSNK